MVPAVGIDLGTTKSVIGVWQNGECCIIPDNVGHLSIPSLVVITADERILVGRQAQAYRDRHRSKSITISSVKRLMGRKGETGWGWWKTYPQEVSAFVLAELKNQAEGYLGKEIKRAVIAIPSHFDEAQRRATKEAAEIAGIEVTRLLNEATAAVLAYGLRRQGDQRTLVFDFGGGTLDISIVGWGEGTYQVHSIEGDSRLGGDDFDQVVLDCVLDSAEKRHGSGIEWDPVQKAILREAAEKAKVELSGTSATAIYIPGFLRIGQRFHDLDIPVERGAFEERSTHLVDRALVILKRALTNANMRASDLNSVLLLGGTSRIPLVRNAVRKELGLEPITGVDIETCVAEGAIIQSAVLQGVLGELLLLECLPSSYGIGLQGDVFSPLIRKNSTIPTYGSQVFTTTKDNQSVIPIAIYQGEHRKASENSSLCTVELRDIPPAAAGVPQIEVSFEVDVNTIVHVKAKDMGTGREQSTRVESPFGLGDVQLRVMSERLESWLIERKTAHVKSEVDQLFPIIEQLLGDSAMALDWHDVLALRECCASLSRIKTEECSYADLARMVDEIRPVVDSAQRRATQYSRAVDEIDGLAVKSQRLALLTGAQELFNLVTQGVELLRDHIQRHSPFDELHMTLQGVRAVYEEGKATLIKREIDHLRTSGQLARWASEMEKGLSTPSEVRSHALQLKSIDCVRTIVELLEDEDTQYRQSIQRRISDSLRGDSYSEACFLLIVSSFTDHRHVSEIRDVPLDDENSAILAFAIFDLLDGEREGDVRRIAARAAADCLTHTQYVAPTVDRITRESDVTVRKHLLDCVSRHSPGVLGRLLADVDAETRSRIATDKELLIQLAGEPDPEVRVFALQSLLAITPCNDTQVSDVFAQALLDPASRIRVLAIEFMESETTLPHVCRILTLLKSEDDELVVERAVEALCNSGDPEIVPHLLTLLLERSPGVVAAMTPALERQEKMMSDELRRFSRLARLVVLGEHTVGARDSLFLWRFSRKHPNMRGLVKMLKQRVQRKGR